MKDLIAKGLLLMMFSYFTLTIYAQNPKIKCYFNHPVNNALSTGVNAVYLNTTFPDTIAAYINRAKYTIDVAVYNFTSNGKDSVVKIATAINKAHKRGVVIRWINDGKSNNTGMALLDSTIPFISSPSTTSYGIMHNKFVVIDVNSANVNDAYVITGSYNFSQQQAITDYNNIIIFQDKNLATAFYDQFNQMWGGKQNNPDTTVSQFGTHKVTSKNHYFTINGTKVQVHFSPKDTCGYYIKTVANSANNDLSFGIYTFTDNSIANIILNKFNSNVSVRGIMDNFSKTYTPYTTLNTALANNMVLYAGAGLYHNKVMIADALLASSDPQVGTGSFNWTNAAETSNDENLIIIHDSFITNQYYQSVCRNITDNGGNACIAPLPLDWVSFKISTVNNGAATLNWSVANEISNDHFEIEASVDGVHFTRLGIVKAKNATIANYSFIDKNSTAGINYYRIKQVDEDGNFTFSKTITAYNRTTSYLSVYPNPAINTITILLPTGATQVTLYSVLGERISVQSVQSLSTAHVDISQLKAGSYLVEVNAKEGKMVKQFEKL